MILVSACLTGCRCRYDGTCFEAKNVEAFLEGQSCFAVCPEVEGGLPVPRTPAELQEGRVITSEGNDVTEEYGRGALAALNAAQQEAARRGEEIELAILKARSPSCGAGVIYDGTFSHTRISGNGVFAHLLAEAGIPVLSEEEVLEEVLEEDEEDSFEC